MIIMDFIALLETLCCRDHIMSFLGVNDLLRLRRVCKYTKGEADDFIQTQKVLTGRELEIYLANDDDPFEEWLLYENGPNVLPSRKRVHFDMSGFNERSSDPVVGEHLWDFLETVGHSITHLTLSNVDVPFYSPKLIQFFESFRNLAHLTIRDIKSDCQIKLPSPSEMKFPSILKKLKTFKVLHAAAISIHFLINENVLHFFVKLVEICITNLEQLSFPFEQLLHHNNEWKQQATRLACRCLFDAPNLKVADLYGGFIEELLRPDNRTPEMGSLGAMVNILNEKVISVRDPRKTSYLPEYPNLEQIDFEKLSRCTIPEPGSVKRDWPKLKVIRGDLYALRESDLAGRQVQVWDILFGGGIVRQNVVKLEMVKLFGFWDLVEPHESFPRTMEIVTSCPNLKILRVGSLFSGLVTLSELWGGLPHLEELHFLRCRDLKDADFFGEDPTNPSFSSLKNLKVLSFKHTSKMEVTDLFFSQIICHMPLRELVLCLAGYSGVHFTMGGIRSLLGGKFADTIERLYLELDHLPVHELMHVRTLFRSSKMY